MKMLRLSAPAIFSAGLFLYSCRDRTVMSFLMGHVSYFVIFALFFLWVVCLDLYFRARGFSFRNFLRAHYVGLLFSLAVTSIVFVSIGPSVKTHGDEESLLSTSESMVLDKAIYRIESGFRYYGNLNAVERKLPTRPLLFPFLISLLHTLFGFSQGNVFLLNFICLFLLLSGVFIAARASLDLPSACAAVLLTVSAPAVSMFSASGGFDLFSALFFGLTLLSCYGFMASPTGASFSLFWMNGMMFCHTRYESFVYFFVMLAFLGYFRLITLPILKESSLWISLTPVFSLPLLWQRILANDIDMPSGVPVFGAGYFVDHLLHFIRDQLDFSLARPYAGPVNLLGFLIAVILVTDALVRKKFFTREFQRRFITVFGVCVGLNLVLGLSFWGGKPSHPSGARYFLFFSLVSSLMPVFFCAARGSRFRTSERAALVFLSVTMFFIYHPIAVEGRFLNWLIVKREIDATEEALRLAGSQDILAVVHYPYMEAAKGHGAVDFNYANANVPVLMDDLRRHLFRDIVVVQVVSESSGKPLDGYELKPPYALEPPFFEREIERDTLVRASKVRGRGGRIFRKAFQSAHTDPAT